MIRRLAAACALAALPLAASAQDAAAPAAAPAPAAEDPAAKLASLLPELDKEYYLRRHQPGVMDAVDAKLDEAAKLAGGETYDVLWRRSRSLFWRSELAGSDAEKAKLAKQGWDVGEKAVAASPKGGEGHYYAGICAGNYGDAIGVLKALSQGVEAPFVNHVNEAIRRVPALDNGGPSLTMGRYHHQLPWPKRDGAKSKEILEAVVRSFPKNLRAKYYLADTLLKEDEPAEAKKLLDQVLAGSMPFNPAEEKLVKRWAKALLPKVEAEL